MQQTDIFSKAHDVGMFTVRGWDRTTKEYAEKEKRYAQKLKHLDVLIRGIATPRGEASVAISDSKMFLIKMFGNEDYDICLVNTETGVCRKDITSDELDALIEVIDVLESRTKMSATFSRADHIVSYAAYDASKIYNEKYGENNKVRGSPMTRAQHDDLER